MLVKSGVKEIKLGEAMANRIYRALFSENCHENILVRKYWKNDKKSVASIDLIKESTHFMINLLFFHKKFG